MEYYGSLNISPYAQMNYLSHHGIKGQKWGVKMGPPYPLGQGDHSKAEEKAKTGRSVGGIETVGSTKKKTSIVGAVKKAYTESKKEKEKRERAEKAALTKRRNATLKRLRSEGKGFDGDDDPEFLDGLYKKYEEKDKATNIERTKASMKDMGYSDKEINSRLSKMYKGYKPDNSDSSSQNGNSSSQQQVSNTYSQYERDKSDAISRGDARAISRYASEMTTKEIDDATSRIKSMQALNQYIPKETTAMDKLENFMSVVERGRKAAEIGINTYNTAAKIHNSLSTSDKKWKTIGDKQKGISDDAAKVLKDTLKKSGISEENAKSILEAAKKQLNN
jgi:hypothetical protein